MKRLTDLEYLKLNKWHKFLYKLGSFFSSIPIALGHFFKKIGLFFVKLVIGIKDLFVDIGRTFVKGSWKTKVSYFILGFGNIARGQILRGLLFFAFEVIFILYMIFIGGNWISQLGTLGTNPPGEVYDPIYDVYLPVYGDNSFKILLYGILSVIFIIAFIYTWYINVKQNKISEEIIRSGKKLKSGKDDLHSLVDDQFHKTLLALPTIGIMVFTVLPIIFMILIAFTNYDGSHNGYTNNLFTWVGWKNFGQLVQFGDGKTSFAATFGEILGWTLMWAFFATFSNYFLGMLVAIMINKKGIRFKKVWRTILVMTIAIPQFVSLMYVSKIFSDTGLVNGFLVNTLGKDAIPFWTKKWPARITVLLVNIWIGIPYLMLIATGILMNIPADLYESAKIDGANAWKQYTKITLPYMLFVTGPYLLTSFIGNINNFNVIYLLTGGGPTNPNATTSGGSAGYTDLLITWLFKITTTGDSRYYLASVIGIMVFLVIAVISLIVYNIMPSTKNEEDFS